MIAMAWVKYSLLVNLDPEGKKHSDVLFSQFQRGSRQFQACMGGVLPVAGIWSGIAGTFKVLVVSKSWVCNPPIHRYRTTPEGF